MFRGVVVSIHAFPVHTHTFLLCRQQKKEVRGALRGGKTCSETISGLGAETIHTHMHICWQPGWEQLNELTEKRLVITWV